MGEALEHRITTVVAGAGSGKSTMLASWTDRVPAAWYTIDAGDASLTTFAPGLVEALRLRVPGLRSDLAAAAAGRGPGADEESRAESLAGLLCESLQEALAEGTALILDDVSEIEPMSPAARMIEALTRQAPPNLHVVLSSRSEAPFPIQRLRGRGQVLEIRGHQLAFSLEEVEAVLRAVSIDPEPLGERLREMTGGWPTAVRLGAEMLAQLPEAEREPTLGRLARPEGPVFEYLADEVLRSERPDVRELLARLAPLERFSPELCEALGIEGAGEMLGRLVRGSVLVEPLPGGGSWMRLNPLVREVLLHEEVGGGAASLIEAAAWLEERDELELALRSLRGAGDPDALAGFLRRHGERLIDGGSAREVEQATAEIPDRSLELEIVLGIARQALGEWDGALKAFSAAAGEEGALPARVAWRVGLIHYLRGTSEDASRAFARGEIGEGATADEGLLLAWTAALHWMQGDAESCRSAGDRALRAAEVSGDQRALAAAHTAKAMLAALEGDRRANDAHYLKALEAAEHARDMFQIVRIRTNRASHLFEEGWYERAHEELDLAIRAGEIAGFTPFLALAYSNRGFVWFLQGELDRAVRDFQHARSLYQRLDSRGIAYPLTGLGDVYRERGDLALARGAYEEAVRQSEPQGDLQGAVPALAGLGRLMANDDPEEALSLCERAMAFPDNLAHVEAVLSAGWVALVTGDRPRGLELGRAAGLLARGRRDRKGLAEALELQALASDPADIALLEEAGRLWDDLGNALASARLAVVLEGLHGRPPGEELTAAERRLAGFGVRLPAAAAGPLAALPVVAPKATTVRTLGGFTVIHDGKPVPASAWQSKKSRDLLKVLIARRGRSTHREALMDTLWPEEDPETVANRLSVALSGLRSALDPGHRFGPDHYVAGDREAVGLNLEHLGVDVEAFLTLAEQGHSLLREGEDEEGLAGLRSAEALYTGDFLEEDPYEEWAIPLREEARAAYIGVAGALAERAWHRGDQETAIRCSLRILERDPFDESASLGLVRAAVASGRHGEARRHYQTYVSRMRELDVEPAPFPSVGS